MTFGGLLLTDSVLAGGGIVGRQLFVVSLYNDCNSYLLQQIVWLISDKVLLNYSFEVLFVLARMSLEYAA